MTGAILPSGCDCVVPVERISVADGWAERRSLEIEPGMNVHRRARDSEQGELLLAAGSCSECPTSRSPPGRAWRACG